ncbi:MAG: hypothetical protein VYB09_09145 [Planctomycetota bacterium]|nr:hypothetical protein [Planctomycetota bacterium]
MRVLFSLFLLLASSILLVAEDDPAVKQRETLVKQLILLLDSDQLSSRQAAEKELLQLGPSILTLLPSGPRLPSDEVRQRLARIRGQLEKELAVRASGATLIDLAGMMTVNEALQSLAQQTGNRVILSLENNTPMQLDFSKATYFKALDQILDAGQLELAQVRAPDGSVIARTRPQEQRARSATASYSSLFRIEPVRITAVRDLRNPAITATQLALDISWEPRLQPIYLAVPLSSIKARSDNGEILRADDPEGVRTANMEGSVSSTSLQIPLQAIPRKATLLQTFHGKLDAVIPGHTGQFSFDILSQENQRLTQGGVEVIMRSARLAGNDCQVDFSVFYRDAANAFESHRGWIRNNPAWLVDQEGNRQQPKQRLTTSQGDRKLDFRFHFPATEPLPSYRFVYQTPVLLLRQSIPFELREIELP